MFPLFLSSKTSRITFVVHHIHYYLSHGNEGNQDGAMELNVYSWGFY